ncbi:UDP-2,4-diacetamido-2,4,6-trideoxy-beta-L-altropyranose hydrolase [Saccharibacillus alkalitolerans]|uniref:UDP-2,4-diacetamido-2,4, 6-trideoxy-beta-L-altropyranose hydrolase n=1 Tax=Saccharibacillus alkalitolerans TaxID=2705290 RepID=A0ABX0F878_9BACL|nr:UDP-2,4-diacetamido-2,4,6-trideoxy-beta-L-altropyranose hydrolase [Saccharibacillus alkalitolerans]NGZ76110.1 UDP-2,4-diacetamido-2,4,6-trideoxy-beta-L-altropyranose hydrolase [Saccharibacillus alkalitolerans]
MKIAIRADSSVFLGAGHVMRCLTLADMLKKSGAEVCFICREIFGNLIGYIESLGYEVFVLPGINEMDVGSLGELVQALKDDEKKDLAATRTFFEHSAVLDWLVVDHYALGEDWESGARTFSKKIFVIDDLADRKHDCDILLNQNPNAWNKPIYDRLVPCHCNKLLGTSYVLLRQEFRNMRFSKRTREGALSRILVFYGGSDTSNETEKALNALQGLRDDQLHIDVVVGQANPHKSMIEHMCNAMPGAAFHCQIDYMAELMNKADLAIGAGGSTTWERCYLGLPALVTILAENQRKGIEELESEQAFINLGWYQDVSDKHIFEQLNRLRSNPETLRSMSRRSLELMDAGKLFSEKQWVEMFV